MPLYQRLFINLARPLSILFVGLYSVYFTLQYNIGEGIKLGMITGILSGVSLGALLTWVMLKFQKPPTDTHITHHTHAPEVREIKCMLLMDRSLAFEVLIETIKKYSQWDIISSNFEEGTINIQTKTDTIQTTIQSLTRHTAQMIFHTLNHEQSIQKLISQMKEKECKLLK